MQSGAVDSLSVQTWRLGMRAPSRARWSHQERVEPVKSFSESHLVCFVIAARQQEEAIIGPPGLEVKALRTSPLKPVEFPALIFFLSS